MKKIILVFFTTLLFVNTVYAEEYSCSYIYKNKSYAIEFRKEGNKIYEVNQFRDDSLPYQILEDTNNILIFGHSVIDENLVGYQLIIINKSKMDIVSRVVFESEGEKNHLSATVYGSCTFN